MSQQIVYTSQIPTWKVSLQKKAEMKTITENGVKKYLIEFISNEYWMATTGIFNETFIKGNIYKVFKMKNGYQVIVEGYLMNEMGKKYKGVRTFYKSQLNFLKNNFKYCE